METILFAFVGLLCLMLGVRVFCAEEQNKIFNKRPIKVTDVKKYNHVCGVLIIGYGVAAEITLYFLFGSKGWVSTVLTLAIVAESIILVAIYNMVERKFIVKR